MIRLTRTVLTSLLAFSAVFLGEMSLTSAVSAQGTAQVIITGIPPILQSPFVTDFEQSYQQRQFQMQFVYGGTQSAAFRFVATMSKEGQTLFSVTSSPTLYDPGTYLYNHFRDDPSVSWPDGFDDLIDQLSGQIKRQIIESGAFPEGFYSVRVEAIPDDPMVPVTSVPGLSSFSVIYPEPPRLLAVSDQETLTTFHPIFSWTPVIAPPGAAIEYKVLITEVLSDQEPLHALQSNREHANVTLSGQTTFPYIASHLPLEGGKMYVWQVAASAELGGLKLPLKDQGMSEIWTFSVAGASSLSVAWLDPAEPLVFTAGSRKAMVSYNVLFDAPVGETFTPDTYVLHWSDPQGGDVHEMTRSIPPGDTQDIDYWAGEKAGTFANLELTESEFDLVAGKLFSANLFGSSSKLILELRGHDSKGNAVVGQTNWIPVELEQSEYVLSVDWLDPAEPLVFTAGSRKAMISYDVLFGAPVGETFTPDTYVLHWSDPQGGDVHEMTKSIPPGDTQDIDYWAGEKAGTFANLELTESEFDLIAGKLFSANLFGSSSKLILELRGHDSKGNPVVGQTNWIPVEFTQSEYVLSVEWLDSGEPLVFTAGSRTADIDYKLVFDAPAGEEFTPDTYVLHFQDRNAGTTHTPIEKPIAPQDAQLLAAGGKGNVYTNLKLTESEFDLIAGKLFSANLFGSSSKLILELRGHDSKGNPVVGQTNWIPVEFTQSEYVLSVEWLDSGEPLVFTAGSRTADIDYKLVFDAPAGEEFTPDTYVLHFQDRNAGTTHTPIEKPIAPQDAQLLAAGGKGNVYTNLKLTESEFDLIAGKLFSANLFGSSSKLILELRGHDSKGNPVVGQTNWIPVEFTQSEYVLSVEWTDANQELVFTLGSRKAVISYDVFFEAEASETFTADTYVLHWQIPKTGELHPPMEKPATLPIWGPFDANKKTKVTATLELTESEFTQVAGPQTATGIDLTDTKLILELRGTDGQGNPMVGQTNWITVQFRQSEYALDVAWLDPAKQVTMHPIDRSADVTYHVLLDAPAEMTVKLDEFVYHWYDADDGKAQAPMEKVIAPELVQTLTAGEQQTVYGNVVLSASEHKMLIGPGGVGGNWSLVLELRGKDSQGNPVAGKTSKKLPVLFDQALIVKAPIDGKIQLSPTTHSALIEHEFIFNVAGETFTPDYAYVLHWKDGIGGAELKTMDSPIPAGLLKPYAAGTHTLQAEIALEQTEFDDLFGTAGLTRYLRLELRGTDSQGNVVTGVSPVNEVTVGQYALDVAWLDPAKQVTMHPIDRSADVTYHVLLDAPAEMTVKLDEFVYHWYDADDGKAQAPMEKVIAPELVQTLTAGEQQTVYGNVVLSASEHKMLIGPGGVGGNWSLVLELRGKDSQGNPVAGKTSKKLPVLFDQALIVKAPIDGKIQLSPTTHSALIEHEFIFNVAGETFTPDYAYVLHWKDGIGGAELKTMDSPIPAGLLKPYAAGTHTLQAEIALEQTEFDDLFGTAGLTRYLRLELRGTDSQGNVVTGVSPVNEVTLTKSAYDLYVKWTDPEQLIHLTPISRTVDTQCDITFAGPTTESFTPDTYVLHWYDTYGKTLAPMQKPIPSQLVKSYASGKWQTVQAQIELSEEDFNTLLGTESKDAMRKLRLELRGTDSEGNLVTGITTMALLDTEQPVEAEIDVMFSSDTGQIDDTETLVATAGYYELIPNVAFVQALENLTDVKTVGANRKLDGVVRLVLIPKPFNSIKLAVDATGLVFAPKKDKKDHWEIKGGLLSETGTATKPDLFRLYWDIVRVNQISYDHARSPNPMLIDKAEAHLPVLGKGIYLTDLVIDKNGLQLKSGEADVNAFGWTFRVKDIQHKSATTGTEFSFTTGLRRGQTAVSQEFAEATFKATNVGGKTSVDIAVNQAKPFQLIPNTDYLNLTSVDFDYTSSDDWIMKVDVQSNDLPLMSKLGPLGGRLEYERSGKLRGMLEFIPRETSPGMPSADNTWFALGKWAKVDLTYAGVQLGSKQVTNGNGEKEWEFDASQSKIQMTADLYLPPFGDPNNLITLGTVTTDKVNPGIWVDFNGDVGAATVTIAQKRKLDLGPVHLDVEKLYVKVEPSFEIGFGGALGIDAGGVVKSEVSIKNLALNENGELNFGAAEVVEGAEFTIVEVLKLGVDDIAFSGSPTTLQLAGKGENVSVQVDSYFRLKGASLDIPGSGSGGVEDLVVYEAGGNTSFAIRGATLSIEDLLALNLDFRYIKDDASDTQFLSAGGKAVFGSDGGGKAKATDTAWGLSVYGNVGKRNGLDYWGFFAMLQGEIPVGPINLTQVGGGFFWNPVQEDIDAVTKLSGFSDPKLLEPIAQMKPASTDPMEFAVMLTGGVSIGQKNFFKGSALLVVTGSMTKLNLKASALADFAKGTGYLLVNYNPAYVVGDFQVRIMEDMPLVDCAKSNLTFYHYPDMWGVMGRIDVGLFKSVIKSSAEVYVGSDGFLFDFKIAKELDLYVISGGLSAEVMAWYRKDVSWGAWAEGKAYGELLYGLIGGEVGLEGAFIGEPEYVVFLAGHLKVEVCYIDVFNGRVWISVGESGFDSGTGKNKKYDGIIADARNTGKEMKSSMDKLAQDIANAQKSLMSLTKEEAAAAGTALVYLMEIPGFHGHMRDLYQQDIDFVIPAARQSLIQAREVMFNPQSPELGNMDRSLSSMGKQIDAMSDDLKTKETQVSTLLQQSKEVISGILPTVQEAGSFSNPVGTVTEMTVECLDPDTGATKTCVRKTGFSFDAVMAKDQEAAARKERADSEAYRQQLVKLAREYSANLKSIDALLSGGGLSVNSLIGDYAQASQLVGNHAMQRLDLFDARVALYGQQANQLAALRPQIFAAISKDVADPSSDNKATTLRRNSIQDDLVQLSKLLELQQHSPGKLPNDPPEWPTWANLADTAGANLWYKVPKAGFDAVVGKADASRVQFVREFQYGNDAFQADWSVATLRADKVYHRKAELYALLYDLLDRLSLLAGTRQETAESSGALKLGAIATAPGALPAADEGTAALVQTPGQTQDVGAQFAGGAITSTTGLQDWDFEKERIFVKQMLQVPQISGFSGQIISDRTPGYARLSLSWSATHPQGVAEYSLDIPDYSKPVQVQPAPAVPDEPAEKAQEPVVKVATVVGSKLPVAVIPSIVLLKMQEPGTMTMLLGAQVAAVPPGEQAALPTATQNVPVTPGQPVGVGQSIVHAWRSLAIRTQTTVPFFRGVHNVGAYQVWLRARGAGGMTLSRLASINVDYAYTAEGGQDFGAPTKQDVLDSQDDTPPMKPYVDGGGPAKTPTMVYANWNALDYESGIQEYQYRVVTKSGEAVNPLTAWYSAGGQTEMNIKLDDPMQPGQVYFVQVRARNGAGMWSELGISGGTTLEDPTPPTQPVIRRPVLANDSLTVSWLPAQDPESNVVGYRFAVGSRPQSANVIDWTHTSNTYFVVALDALQGTLDEKRVPETTAYVSVCAVNGLGITGPLTSLPVEIEPQTIKSEL